jgi:archaellum biogenesis ATPase FlaH
LSKVEHKLTEVLLTIEGIPTLELFYSEEQITQFISGLSTLSAVYKQINILVSKQVNKRIVVSLERLSTCIISLDKKLEPSKWRCVMVVRRYTGFSNEQDYVIELTENQLKVNKHKQ